MVSDIEGVRSLEEREMSRSIRDGICVFVVVVVVVVAVVLVVVVVLIVAMGLMGVVMLMVVVAIVVLVMVVRVACVGVVGVVGVLCIGVLEVGCVGVVDVLVLSAVFVVEVVEGMELVVGCVVRLVLWCVNGRGYFLRCFSLKLVEINGMSVGGFVFGIVIWADALLDVVVVKVIAVEAVDVVQVWFFIFFRRGCLGDMMDVRVVIEVVVGVVEVPCSVRVGV